MRNRGLEIYMLEQENEETYDMKSVINNEGLKEDQLIKYLVEINKFINEMTLGEKNTVNQILQASFLISQQITRGIRSKEAFTRTVMEIYYKTRSNSDFTVTNPKEAIVDEIERIFSDENYVTFVSDVTLKTNDLQTDSLMARIKQQAVMPIKHRSDRLLRYFLVHYYTISNKDDLTLRTLFMKKIIDEDLMDILEKVTRKELISSSTTQRDDFPLDSRWLSLKSSPFNENNVNNLVLMLYYNTVKYFDELEDDKYGRKGVKEFTLLRYAFAVKRKIIDCKIDDVALKSIANLFELFDVHFVNNVRNSIDNATLIDVISLLSWRFVIYKFLRDNHFETKSKHFAQLLTNFHLHYKWFVKKSITNVNRSLKCFDSSLEIGEIVKDVSAHLSGHFSILRKLAKYFRRTLRLPPPLINQIQIETADRAATLFAKNTLHDKACNFIETITRFIQNPNTRENIAKLKFQMDYEYNVQPDFNLSLETDLIDEVNSIETDSIKTGGRLLKKIDHLDVKILPLYDYMAVLQLLSSRNLPENFKKIPTIPAVLIALIERYNVTVDERLQCELTSTVSDYKINAPAINNKPYIIFDVKDVVDEENVAVETLSLHNPILTFVASELLLDDERDRLKPTSFGNYRISTRFHRNIKGILWNNIQQLSDERFDFVRNELIYLKGKLQDFAINLATSLNAITSGGDVTTILENCLQKLKETFDKEKILIEILNELLMESRKLVELNVENGKLQTESCHFVRLNLIANLYVLLNLFKSLLNSNLPPIDRLIKLTFKKRYAIDERENFENLLKSYELQNEVYSNSKKNLHPLCENIKAKIMEIDEKITNFDKYVAIRPENLTYATVINVSRFS